MELLLVLLLLYALQCTIRVPAGGVLFVRGLLAWRISAGPSWGLLHPIPSGASYLACRFLLIEDERGLCGRSVVARFGSSPHGHARPRLSLGSGDSVDVRGRIVLVNQAAFAREPSRHEAEATANRLRSLLRMPIAAAREAIGRELCESLSLNRFREESTRARSATSLLMWSSDLYFLLLFVGFPILVWLGGAKHALFVALPMLFAMHLATLFALAFAHRRLFPNGDAELLERLLACAIYPPELLFAIKDVHRRILARFHPATIAAAVLPSRERERFLRSELGRVQSAIARVRDDPRAMGLAVLERDALFGLIDACGESRDAMLAPRIGDDPFALAYCPICLFDYCIATGDCADCGAALVRYGR